MEFPLRLRTCLTWNFHVKQLKRKSARVGSGPIPSPLPPRTPPSLLTLNLSLHNVHRLESASRHPPAPAFQQGATGYGVKGIPPSESPPGHKMVPQTPTTPTSVSLRWHCPAQSHGKKHQKTIAENVTYRPPNGEEMTPIIDPNMANKYNKK